ncbi:DUF3095 domain-containing protein [Jiella sp. MQZ9-1]|nr:DUF3095 domain-containing protein [Jiella flava]
MGGSADDALTLFEALPVETDFARLADPAVYHPLPGDWLVGLADIERSTDAVDAGHYKAVNTVAAAVIAAIANEIPQRDFPFVFAGDGAGFALPPELAPMGRQALSAVAGWAREAFGFHLRIAALTVDAVRATGRDVAVARFAASPDVSYTMFSGGGLAYAEARMKLGDYALQPAEGEAARPNLSGLICRFAPIPARHGVILSVIALPAPNVAVADFSAVAAEILALAGGIDEAGRPVPESGPVMSWPTSGLLVEARATAARSGQPLWLAMVVIFVRSLLSHLIFTFGIKVGAFDPARYRATLVQNTDFRKFDDGLRLTLDCSPQVADSIAERMSDAEAAGIIHGGLHRQDAALMTCFVPAASRSDHVHFVDGAMGGYAAAAAMAFRKAAPARPQPG